MRRHRLVLACALGLAPLIACTASTMRMDDDSTDELSTSRPPLGTDPGLSPTSGSNPVTCDGDGGTRPNSAYKWAFFGDLHLHTQLSFDAFNHGTRTLPDDAYNFAKRLPDAAIQVGTGTSDPPGITVQIDRPIDFLAVTDHSEFLGMMQGCTRDPDSGFYDTAMCGAMRNTNASVQDQVYAEVSPILGSLCSPDSGTYQQCLAENQSGWSSLITAAKNAYDACRFTSLVGYEWSDTINGATNHRNVIFSTDDPTALPRAPFDSVNYKDTMSLWTALDGVCGGDGGCSAITIPHNTNESNGLSLVLPPADAGADALALMHKYQRLVEVYQAKGNSECYHDPDAGAPESECLFERADKIGNDIPASYVRTALKSGMQYANDNPGALNPFRLGLVGGTDNHNATPAYVQETNPSGHTGRKDDQPEERIGDPSGVNQQFSPGGITGVWAEQNTRDRIFAALYRRETFATSGPRIQVRFYATNSANACAAPFPQTMIDAHQDLATMGGSIHSSDLTAGSAPTFVIAAWPDSYPQAVTASPTPRAAALVTVQVIRAYTSQGSTVEAPIKNLSIPPQGGCQVWQDDDPHFDPTERAIYYVRVLQEPTWRWSHWDCQVAGDSNPTGCQNKAGPTGTNLDVSVQERAWTSPIWYVP